MINIYSSRDIWAQTYIALDENKNFLGKLVLKYNFVDCVFTLDHLFVEEHARRQGVATSLIDTALTEYSDWFKVYGVYATSHPTDGLNYIDWGNFLVSRGIRVSGNNFSQDEANKNFIMKFGPLTLKERLVLFVKKKLIS